jgi:hypothetical protein
MVSIPPAPTPFLPDRPLPAPSVMRSKGGLGTSYVLGASLSVLSTAHFGDGMVEVHRHFRESGSSPWITRYACHDIASLSTP